MNESKNGGPAFPRPVSFSEEGGNHYGQTGMSLRDYFAAKALNGLCADPNVTSPAAEIVEIAYALADAMLAARERHP